MPALDFPDEIAETCLWLPKKERHEEDEQAGDNSDEERRPACFRVTATPE